MTQLIVRFSLLLSLTLTALTGCGNGADGKADVQYAALGASDAVGIGASPITNGYVYLIKEGIENGGKSVNQMNYGIVDLEIGAIRDVELAALDLGFTPDVVTLFTGANDIIAGASAASFENDLDAILNHLSKINEASVFVADLPDLTKLPRFIDNPDADVTRARVAQFNSIIVRTSNKYGATVINLSAEPVLDADVSDDGLHPNDQGHRKVADRFLAQILPAVYN